MLDLTLKTSTGYDYAIEAGYMDYLNNKIANEERLRRSLTSMLNEGATVVTEASVGDSIKNKWQKFVAFIKGVFGKFTEKISNFFLNNKDYLEKYKDIILNKKVISESEITYVGDLQEMAKRCRLLVPQINNINDLKTKYLAFDSNGKVDNDETDKKFFKAVTGKEYNINNAESLAENFKQWYMNADGEAHENVALKNATFKMVDLYNFCMSADATKKNTNTDINAIEKFIDSIADYIKADAKNTSSGGTGSSDSASSGGTGSSDSASSGGTGSSDSASSGGTGKSTGNTSDDDEDYSHYNFGNESAMLLHEDEKAPDTKFSINTHSQHTQDDNNDSKTRLQSDSEENGGVGSEDGQKIVDAWKRCCQALVTSKWTAVEEVTKNMMAIIREHVKSYIGNEKDKANDRATKEDPTKYTNDGKSYTPPAKKDQQQGQQQEQPK